MSDALRGHCICCITDEMVALLSDSTHYTVSVNKDDCWTDEELFKYRAAVNLKYRTVIAGTRKQQKLSDGEVYCVYDDRLRIEFQAYVSSCDEATCQALAILGDIQSRLSKNVHALPIDRITREGYSFQTNSDGEQNAAMVAVQLDIEYRLVEEAPWKIFKSPPKDRTNT